MLDNKTAQIASCKSLQHLLTGTVFVVLGFALHPLFFVGVLSSLIFAQTTRQNKMIAGMVSLVFLLLAFGYSLGKDLAVRDNIRDAKSAVSADKTP
jgi:hypothetical protein